MGAGGVGLGRADQGHEGMVDQDVDVGNSPADGGLVQAPQSRPRTGLAQHAGVAQARQLQVVQKGLAEQLGRQVQAGLALADDPQAIRRLRRGLAGGRPGKVDLAGQAPVVEAARLPALEERPVANIQLVGVAAQPAGRGGGEQRAHLGAGGADGRTGKLDRHRPHGQPFVGNVASRRGNDAQPGEGRVQLVGGDLGQGGGDPLAVLHAPESDTHAAIGFEADPAVEARVGGEHGGDHAGAPSRIRRAARATASRMRLCTPQRQRCQSSAWAISPRLGSGLRSSSALAPTRMPERQ